MEPIAVPYHSGRHGQRMGAGPTHLLQAGLGTRLESAGHHVHIRTLELPHGSWSAEIGAAFDLAGAVAARSTRRSQMGDFPLVLSGNCGPAALGCVGGLRSVSRVLWFDAHGDFNTPETTVSGYLDGMALAAATGRCWTQLTNAIPGFVPVPEAGVTLIGARDVDEREAAALRASAVRCVGTQELRTELPPILAADKGSRPIVVSPPGSGRPGPKSRKSQRLRDSRVGWIYDDLEWAIARITEGVHVKGSALTAFDPGSDVTGRACDSALAVAMRLVDAVSAAATR